MILTRILSSSTALALAAGLAMAQDNVASTTLQTAEGEPAGTATFVETRSGMLIDVMLMNVAEGVHAIHVHAVGACTPVFEAAGEHLAGEGETHGFVATDRPHAGDLPNIVVNADGTGAAQFLNERLLIADMLDDDGAALIVHTGQDSFQEDPAAAGEREACGVIRAGTGTESLGQ